MLGRIFDEEIRRVQHSVYNKLNTFSEKNPTKGRLLSLPVAILDTVLDTFKYPLSAIENLVFVCLNILGAAFSKACSLKHAIGCFQMVFCFVGYTPASVITSPFRVIYQTLATIYSPQTVTSFNIYSPTFNERRIQMVPDYTDQPGMDDHKGPQG